MPQAPRYDWICYSCQAVNPAGEAWCSSCHGPASVLGAKIKSIHTPPQAHNPMHSASTKSPPSVFALLICGLYLLAGAFSAISQQKWPAFMPPQLDFVAFLSGVLGDVASAYIAGSISGLLGIFCLAGSAYAASSEA